MKHYPDLCDLWWRGYANIRNTGVFWMLWQCWSENSSLNGEKGGLGWSRTNCWIHLWPPFFILSAHWDVLVRCLYSLWVQSISESRRANFGLGSRLVLILESLPVGTTWKERSAAFVAAPKTGHDSISDSILDADGDGMPDCRNVGPHSLRLYSAP